MVPSWLINLMRVLVGMTVGLMALGAGVRTMKAGLACPDWPLCFGQIVPDFHVGVWFEFVHRAYAGLVALIFFFCWGYLLTRKTVPIGVKFLGGLAFLTLLLQIIMGGLTVLKLLRFEIVTSHLMLATFFLSLVLWITFRLAPNVEKPPVLAPVGVRWFAMILPLVVLVQILLGGLVASSYAGSVCVDFPLCNGQWVPTLRGAVGLQVIHRFGAYFVGFSMLGFFLFLRGQRGEPWMTGQMRRWAGGALAVVLIQIGIGIGNLLLYIPAWMSVLHLTFAILLLCVTWRISFIARSLTVGESIVSIKYDDQSAALVTASGP